VGCASVKLFLNASSLSESWRFALERSNDALSPMPQRMQIMSPADIGESFSDDEPETAIDLSLQCKPSLVLVRDSFDLPEIFEQDFDVLDLLPSNIDNESPSEDAADATAYARAPTFASATICNGALSVPKQALQHDVHSQRSVSEASSGYHARAKRRSQRVSSWDRFAMFNGLISTPNHRLSVA